MKSVKIGGHLSIKDGLGGVVLAARALDYAYVQLMLGDGRSYTPVDLSTKDLEEYQKMMYGIGTYVHLPYVINPCEGEPSRVGFYKRAYRQFCSVASGLGAKAVVLHPGFKKELTEEKAMENMVKFLDSAHDEDWRLQCFLETDSGSKNGSAVGSPEFIQKALTQLDSTQFAMCIDTVHLYARGIDMWQKDVRSNLLSQFQKEIQLVHLNSPDPKVTLGSFLDLHNTPFQDRPEWKHKDLFKDLQYLPCILERRSLSVQEQDALYIRELLT